ncbi:hypothetical protein QAD02_003622 [Eretmocerus hayati]|uniref:Uncharacterized protein n=1 Tax=Eretmocerus hayati TaxID=131215 RepID=A0ACC2NNG7_9HYME|nr:hypothetical protein QAD02_003622 [Eretmocerus hayati]
MIKAARLLNLSTMDRRDNDKDFAVIRIQVDTAGFADSDQFSEVASKHCNKESRKCIRSLVGTCDPHVIPKFNDFARGIKIDLPDTWPWVECDILWFPDEF